MTVLSQLGSRFAALTIVCLQGLLLAFVSTAIPSFASGETITHRLYTAANPTGPTFDFTVKSDCKGCIYWSDYQAGADFPVVNGKTVTRVRMYVSKVSFQDVTLQSRYIEMPIIIDQASNSIMLPDVRLGNLPAGTKLYFKAGLVDVNGNVVYFSNDNDVTEAKNSTTTQ